MRMTEKVGQSKSLWIEETLSASWRALWLEWVVRKRKRRSGREWKEQWDSYKKGGERVREIEERNSAETSEELRKSQQRFLPSQPSVIFYKTRRRQHLFVYKGINWLKVGLKICSLNKEVENMLPTVQGNVDSDKLSSIPSPLEYK